MRVNVEKVLERDQKLSEMEYRAGELQCKINLKNEPGPSQNKQMLFDYFAILFSWHWQSLNLI